MLRTPSRSRRLTGAIAVTAAAAWLGTIVPPPAAAAPAAAPAAAAPAAAPFAAKLFIGNADDDRFSGVVDVLGVGAEPTSFPSAVDEDDAMAVGDLVGDSADEVVVVDDDTHVLDIHDVATKQVTRSFETRFDAEEDGLAVGNVLGDPHDEILIGDEALSQVIIYRQTGEQVRILNHTGFDATDRLLAGDLNADGYDEIIIANDEDGGRVDALTEFGSLVEQEHTGFDGGDAVAVGEVTGDAFADIVVANADDGGDVEIHDLANDLVHHLESAYDSDDKLAVGDVTGSGTAEIVVANTEEKGRVDVHDLTGPGSTTIDSGYDGDDRFAVGTFGNGNIDGDEIPDRVELSGIRNHRGGLVLDIAALGASPCRKDIIVEIDYMIDSASGGHDHRPGADAVGRVRNALDNERVRGVADCPYQGVASDGGLNLIVNPQTTQGEQVSEQAVLALPEGFDEIKRARFDHNLDPYVRYSLWIHDFSADGELVDADGRASPGSDDQDFLMSIGNPLAIGDPDIEAATFLHELGHVMGLRHGGFENTNCKPNYLSIMNYSFPKGFANGQGGWDLGFSPEVLDPLTETSLSEPAGIGGPTGRWTTWTNAAGTLQSWLADEPLDWSGDDRDGNGTDDDDDLAALQVPVDINGKLKGPKGLESCNGEDSTATETLRGYDDWAHLDWSIEPVHWNGEDDQGLTELTTDQFIAMSQFWDQQSFPDTAVQLQPQLPGYHGTSLGMAMDEQYVYATHHYRTVTQPSTSDEPGTLVVLDRASLSPVDAIPVGFGARSVAVNPVTDRIYVVNGGKGSYNLTVVDSGTRQVVDEIAVGQVPVDVEVNTRLNRVYVSNPYQQVVHVIDGATNSTLESIPIGPAHGMSVDESTGTVYVALSRRGTAPEVAALGTIVDDGGSRPRVLPSVDLGDPLVQPTDVAVDPVRDRIYVGGLGGATVAPSVTVLDQPTRQQITRLPMPGPVRAIDINADAGLVFAVGDRGVEVLDTRQLRIVRHIDAGLPFAVATETGPTRQLYVGDFVDGKLRRLSYSSGQPV